VNNPANRSKNFGTFEISYILCSKEGLGLLRGFGIRLAKNFGGLFSANKSSPTNRRKAFPSFKIQDYYKKPFKNL
jgi:hypothetical protein